MRNRDEEKIIEYTKAFKYIEYLLKPNLNEKGVDLHRFNVQVNTQMLEKFGYTERELRLEMSKDFPSLKPLANRVKDLREDKLVNHSLTKQYDGNFAKFVLSNKFDWAEKQETKNTNIDFSNFDIKDLIEIEEDTDE